MKQITVYGLLSKIYNYNGNIPMPKRINCCGYEYKWDNGFQDYIRTDEKNKLSMSFLENHSDNLQYFLQDTVDILDDEIENIKTYYNEELEEYTAETTSNGVEYRVVYGGDLGQMIFDKLNELIDKVNEMNNED